MQEVIREYGTVVLAAIIGMGLLALIFGITVDGRRGLGEVAGGVMDVQTGQALKNGSSTVAYEACGDVTVDEIWFDSRNPMYSGERIRLDEHFFAIASDGSVLDLRVLGLRDSDGRSIEVVREDNADYATFAGPGIYRIYLRVESEQVRSREAVVAFPVEKG